MAGAVGTGSPPVPPRRGHGRRGDTAAVATAPAGNVTPARLLLPSRSPGPLREPGGQRGPPECPPPPGSPGGQRCHHRGSAGQWGQSAVGRLGVTPGQGWSWGGIGDPLLTLRAQGDSGDPHGMWDIPRSPLQTPRGCRTPPQSLVCPNLSQQRGFGGRSAPLSSPPIPTAGLRTPRDPLPKPHGGGHGPAAPRRGFWGSHRSTEGRAGVGGGGCWGVLGDPGGPGAGGGRSPGLLGGLCRGSPWWQRRGRAGRAQGWPRGGLRFQPRVNLARSRAGGGGSPREGGPCKATGVWCQLGGARAVSLPKRGGGHLGGLRFEGVGTPPAATAEQRGAEDTARPGSG